MWSVVSVASGLRMIYLICFYPMVRLELESKAGLEAAIHSFRRFLHNHKDNPNLCAVKLDMYNAFNKVQ